MNNIEKLEFGTKYQMSGIVFNTGHHSIIIPLPNEDVQLGNVQVLNLTEEEYKELTYQLDILEVELVGQDKAKKTLLRKSQRQIDQRISWEVYDRDRYMCRYCGDSGIPLTVDHIILWEELGPSIPRNLMTSCKKCNRTRHSMQYHEWLISEYYQRVSFGLTEEEKKFNIDMGKDLHKIRRRTHKRRR